jgi:hypothetical protein
MGHGVVVEKHIKGCIALFKGAESLKHFQEGMFGRCFRSNFLLPVLRSSDS